MKKSLVIQDTITLPFESIAVDVLIKNPQIVSNLKKSGSQVSFTSLREEFVISCVDKSKTQLCAISGSLRKGQIYFKVGHS